MENTLADLGEAQLACPPGTQFFCFDIQLLQNVATLGVHTPPMRSTPPLWEILDPPLEHVYF